MTPSLIVNIIISLIIIIIIIIIVNTIIIFFSIIFLLFEINHNYIIIAMKLIVYKENSKPESFSFPLR